MSDDISFHNPHPEIIESRTIWTTCGQTAEPEDIVYQPLPVDVCVYWTSVPDHLVVPQHGSRIFTFVMTADKNRTVAREELIKGWYFHHLLHKQNKYLHQTYLPIFY